MKNFTLLTICAAAFLYACNPTITLTKIQFPEAGEPKEGQIYLLPKKVLNVKVTVNVYKYQVEAKEQNATTQNAFGFLGIEEEDRYLVQVTGVTIEERLVPDYSQAYRLTAKKLSNNFFKETNLTLNLSEEGILKGVTTTNTSHLSAITSGVTTTSRTFLNTILPLPILKGTGFGYLSPSEIEQTKVSKVDTVEINKTLNFWKEVMPGEPTTIRVDGFLRGRDSKVGLKIILEGPSQEQTSVDSVTENAIVYRVPVVRLTRAVLDDNQDYPLMLVAKRYGYNTNRGGIPEKEMASLYVSYPQHGPISTIPFNFKKSGTVTITFFDSTFGLSNVSFNAETLKDEDFANYQKAINELNQQLEQMRKKPEPEKQEE